MSNDRFASFFTPSFLNPLPSPLFSRTSPPPSLPHNSFPLNVYRRFVKENPSEPDFIPQLLSSIFSKFKTNDDGTVLPLPDASASEIETLAIIAEHCLHAALTGHAAPEEVADDCSEPEALFLEVDAMDYCKKWYKAVVIEGSLRGDDVVKVHFVGCTLHSSHASYITLQPTPHPNPHIPTTTQPNPCTGESKYDETIQRSEVPTRIRPRTDSCPMGSSVSETLNQIKKKYKPKTAEAGIKATKGSRAQHIDPVHAQKLVNIPPNSHHPPPLFFFPPPPFLPPVPVCSLGSPLVVQQRGSTQRHKSPMSMAPHFAEPFASPPPQRRLRRHQSGGVRVAPSLPRRL